ncbi:MAG: PEP-CTERM sorting domain-containing protein [Verrucomicrobia bacterium]|nr:PEP-CTERM sorting domain-containing protein [Verrucomicrobiota bacterium]MCH8512824.1 PEP-CTERM sorting domain-containing protein [Kiritimatiellia bacterium]
MLLVSGAVQLDSSFGVGSLLGVDSSLAEGIYTLIDGTATDFSLLGIQNWGVENAYDLGDGKSAYFSQGSLQLTVIPEPGTVVMMVISMVSALGVSWVRRGKKI